MRIGKERRKYLADALSKTAEYTFSVVILGSVASGEFRWNYLVTVAIAYVLLVSVGIAVTPEE